MRKRRWAGLLLALGLIGLFFWVQNRALQTQSLLVPAAVPEAFDGLRIAVLADLHGAVFGPENRNLLAAVEAAGPDLIALCGDLADERYDPDAVRTLAQGLCRIAPTFYVTGNHEWAAGIVNSVTGCLTDCGVTVLANDYRILERGGARIALAGVHDPNGPRDMPTPAALAEQIRAAEGEIPMLLLAHRNDRLETYTDYTAVFSGHGHGGVWRLPGLGGLFGSGGAWRPDFTAGLYCDKDTVMAVSRGLGGHAPRLFNRPQVLIAVLES